MKYSTQQSIASFTMSKTSVITLSTGNSSVGVLCLCFLFIRNTRQRNLKALNLTLGHVVFSVLNMLSLSHENVLLMLLIVTVQRDIE